MKKLLVLALVISMASLASATLTFTTDTIDPSVSGTDVTIGVQSNVANSVADQLFFALISAADSAKGDLDTPVNNMVPDMWAMTFIEAYDDAGQNDKGAGMKMCSASMTSFASGTWFNMDVNINSGGFYVYLYGDDGTGFPGAELDSIWVVPEPMTIALLGLGGLFVRRRK